MKLLKYAILFSAYAINAITAQVYHHSPTSANMQLFAVGLYLIIFMLICLPLIIVQRDPVYNIWVQGMALYVLINNVFNEVAEYLSLLLGWTNKYSPFLATVDKKILLAIILIISAVRVWYFKRDKKAWG